MFELVGLILYLVLDFCTNIIYLYFIELLEERREQLSIWNRKFELRNY